MEFYGNGRTQFPTVMIWDGIWSYLEFPFSHRSAVKDTMIPQSFFTSSYGFRARPVHIQTVSSHIGAMYGLWAMGYGLWGRSDEGKHMLGWMAVYTYIFVCEMG